MVLAISMLATLNGSIMSGARVPFAMARDGYFFKRARRRASALPHAVGGADWCRLVLSIVAAVAGGQLPPALLAGDFCRVALLHDMPASTVFVLRWRDPQAVRPYRVLGYPFVPALFVTVAAVLLYYTFRENWPKFFLRIAGYSGWSACFLLVSLAAGPDLTDQSGSRNFPDLRSKSLVNKDLRLQIWARIWLKSDF
jgi:amino acid transporter